MKKVEFKKACQYALERLERELSPKLRYHSLAHTRDDVVKAVERLAEMEGIRGMDWTILLTATYYHDIGYVLLEEDQYQRNHHEDLSIDVAVQILPEFGYAPEHIQEIQDIILATRLPQNPHTLLEQIIADADLDSLGREDFWAKSQTVRDEQAEFGIIYTDLEWYRNQKEFVGGHVYFTRSARRLRDAQKARNLAEVVGRLECLEKSAGL
jgi:predicted metal-dependent HD superfamily phosphohydrolase